MALFFNNLTARETDADFRAVVEPVSGKQVFNFQFIRAFKIADSVHYKFIRVNSVEERFPS